MPKNITLSVADETHEKMKEHPEMRWSEIARKAIEERLELLDAIDEISSKSRLTEKDACELADKVKRGMAKRHKLV